VLVDLNTQRDFLEPTAVCRVRNGEQLLSAVRRVIAWAKWNHVPVISSVDAHRQAESTHDGFPLHCIDGTRGQGKIPWTLFGSRVRVEADNTLALSLDLFESHQQVIFRKRTHDLFSNPKADRFLTQLQAEEFILFGVGLEFSIGALALGLLARNRKVTVVADCCGYWTRSEADLALRRMHARGADLVTVEQLLHRRLRRWVRYPLRYNGGGNGNGRPNGNGNGQPNGNGNGNGSTR
jgi:nicotinamidase-related amidase